MKLVHDAESLARAEAAFDLCQTVEDMMLQKIRCRHPQASDEEIRQRFAAWVEKRPYVEPSPST